MHEDRLARSARRQVRDRGFGLHVLHRVHADAEMRQQRLGKHLAQIIVNRGAAGRHAIAAAVTAERSEERAVRRAGVEAVQTVDDVQTLLEGLKRLDRLRKLRLGQRTAARHARRNAGLRIESLVLQEEDHALGPTA